MGLEQRDEFAGRYIAKCTRITVAAFGTEVFSVPLTMFCVRFGKPIDLDRMHQLIARLLSPTGSGSLGNV
jgi:hypothetical protein